MHARKNENTPEKKSCENTQEHIQDAIQEIFQENTQESIQENTQGIFPENTQEHIQNNIQEILQENTQERIQGNTQEIFPENTQEHIQDNIQEILQENIQEHIQDAIQEIFQENTQEHIQVNSQEIFQDHAQEIFQANNQANNQESNQENNPDNTPDHLPENPEHLTKKLNDFVANGGHYYLNSSSIQLAMDLIRRGADPNTHNAYILNLLLISQANDEVKELIEKYNANAGLALGFPGDYRIDSSKLTIKANVLGEGISQVYLGNYEGNEVAVKAFVFSPDNYCKSLTNYWLELGNLIVLTESKAENIVKLIGIDICQPSFLNLTQPIYCIVMEKAALGSLQQIIKRNPSSIENRDIRNKIISGMTKGMQFIHNKDLVHADFKSGNVLIADDYEVKIADFGLSRTQGYQGSRGTPIINAPEVLAGAHNTQQSDIFSLGGVIWETISLNILEYGYPAYIRYDKKDCLLLLESFLLSGGRCPISEKQSSFKLEMLVSACWNKDPRKRPTTIKLLTMLGQNDDEVYEQLKPNLSCILSIACKYGRTDLAKDLLQDVLKEKKCRVDQYINQIYQEGCTPLLAACASSHTHNKPELFKLLLEYGANVFCKNIQGQTAYDIIFQDSNEAAINELLPHLAKLKFLEQAMSLETIELAKKWVENNSLQMEYSQEFFKRIASITETMDSLNNTIMSQVKTEQQLASAINKIGFFPSKNGCVNQAYAKITVHWYLTNQHSSQYIPTIFGLRDKAEQIKEGKTKEEKTKVTASINSTMARPK
jgi:serine/threonine protein kinase